MIQTKNIHADSNLPFQELATERRKPEDGAEHIGIFRSVLTMRLCHGVDQSIKRPMLATVLVHRSSSTGN